MNLYEKINAVRKAVDYIQKDKSVSTGTGSYKAVTHDAVTAILRQHLITHGIICVPNLVKSESHEKELLKDGERAKQFRYDATYSFDFVNAEAPTEKVTIIIEAHAMDNADKAPGKAISYAKKYAVLKLFEIETGEDEESRYQDAGLDDNVIIDYISAIQCAASEEELKKIYIEAQKVAAVAKDSVALKKFVEYKDKRKTALGVK